jgi:hypothetical protein
MKPRADTAGMAMLPPRAFVSPARPAASMKANCTVAPREAQFAGGGRLSGMAAKRFERQRATGDAMVARAGFQATAGNRDGSVAHDGLQGFFRHGG